MSLNEWEQVRLGDVVNLLTGHPFRSERYDSEPTSPRLLRGDNVAQGYLRWDGAQRWPINATDGLENYWLQTGDIILAMDRPWIEAGLKYASVRESDLPSLLVQRVARLRGTSNLDTKFLKYVIGGQDFTDYILAIQTGTAVPHISSDQIKNYEFFYPPLPTQHAIARILGSLDDKIELNRQMNETLEAMARAIFQSWFVDFDPVRAKAEGRQPTGMDAETAALFPSEMVEVDGREVPKGWGIGKLSSVIDLLGGGTPQTSVERYWNGDIPWFSVVDAPSVTDMFVIDTEKHITQAGVENSSTNILAAGTTIITARGTVGKLALVGVPMAMNQSCYGIKGVSGYPDFYIHFLLKRAINELQQQTHGTVFETITRQTFDGVEIVIPPEKIAQKFDAVITPHLEKIRNNLMESRTLTQIRDALLPKLMSGEISVNDLS